ncbi:hypothetical protein LEP1GSC034_0655 [Leptospira interrogans str. 2003000735]|uniref:Uncharacterized protein n=2 Tax=Leptospira interrogans TaxID=173 RepID=A0A829DAL4_LEPIR|nr:hypothetical protein [Leptospira interrogans]EMY05898.1 hypothetical protein LEP1GSC029_0621 [Leptospira interrogans str. 2002000626]EMY25112.1 hypothetical protein LEP1GSC115_2313 [Leptospira interrogans serovar Australis str. 200703203]EKN88862.1 hypothetical protein LEP1GSC027_4265 [Leptospira interrogans str. 2002000624]EKQ39052.1 hypothetical protein LEP1GSC025_0579 [Leptospira interrogans str. 2002000621]EKQ48307.1 hypothetical protein LEP1GSC026_4290 [Leptospira interrogans str. 2002
MNLRESFISKFAASYVKPRFEIWFAAILIPENDQAFWIRYSTLNPRNNRDLYSTGAVWVSLFDRKNPKNHRTVAQSFPYEDVSIGENSIEFPEASVGPDHMNGKVQTSQSENLAWDLEFRHQLEPATHLPPWLEKTPIPKTRSIVSSPFTEVAGWIQLANRKFTFQNANGHFNHIWGTNRVSELFWTFVPKFDDDPDNWSMEIVTVRPQQFTPSLTFVTLLKGGVPIHQHSIFRSLRSTTKVEYPKLRFQTRLDDYEILVESEMDKDQIAGYIYRDPDGSPRYVEQSDIGSAKCVIRHRGKEIVLNAKQAAGVEFHGLRPWRKDHQYLDPYQNKY